jgi:pentatricopeptide repeat protein
MEMHGILPDYLTYSSVIQLLSTAKLPKKVVYYLRKMQTEKLLSDCIPSWQPVQSSAKSSRAMPILKILLPLCL